MSLHDYATRTALTSLAENTSSLHLDRDSAARCAARAILNGQTETAMAHAAEFAIYDAELTRRDHPDRLTDQQRQTLAEHGGARP